MTYDELITLPASALVAEILHLRDRLDAATRAQIDHKIIRRLSEENSRLNAQLARLLPTQGEPSP